jgi:hypothetical protein
MEAALRPTEEQALVLTAAIGREEAAIAAFHQWNDAADYTAHFDTEVFRLLPLVYRRMSELGVAAANMKTLKGVYRHAWCEAQMEVRQAAAVIAALQEAGIDVLVLQGAAMKMAVRPRHLPHAIAIEADMPAGQTFLLRGHILADVSHKAADEWFWAGNVPCAIAGVATRQLDVTASLARILLQGVRPRLEAGIFWIAEARMILATSGEDIGWSRILDFARRYRLTRRLRLGLSCLAEQFDAPVPAWVLEELRACRISLTEWAEARYLFDARRSPSLTGRVCLRLARIRRK